MIEVFISLTPLQDDPRLAGWLWPQLKVISPEEEEPETGAVVTS